MTFFVFPARKPYSSTWWHEVQSVYRSQRVEINDKHIEIIIARMLRKVKIENPGDTNLLPGSIMDRFDFRAVNENLSKCLKITHKGDSDFAEGDIVPKDAIEHANTQIEALGWRSSKGNAAEVLDGEYSAARNHQGRRPELELHFSSQLSRDDEGLDRGGTCRKDR